MKALGIREYAIKNTGWIQEKFTKNTQTNKTLAYELISNYVDYYIQLEGNKRTDFCLHITYYKNTIKNVYNDVRNIKGLIENVIDNIEYLDQRIK